ncbi:RagB/SusD family nutrient uptake outer membrane protein [Flagellimonas hymeniacidonis]|uniref:RagB/SusD family nutrient uptake outer membrane protein n=1 Tax=Flagellimonas hymeniacidonis TaxID=2603628 RepID=A0A5C8V1F2_9FLAO|nr:RagB/SusD family nutrient uptake outer membrane protein [Flagellimonas hymeniacidonis]TXN34725.1 RagB/SusD family nutrient uptake outer membrane protein [Flagellimonas hymeniacidonis]
MKKRLFYFATLIALALGCSDSFTDVPAVGALSDDDLKNAQGVSLLLASAYSTLDGIRNNQGASEWTASGDNWWFDVIADDAHKGSTDGDQADLFLLETFDWTSANPYIFGKWNGLFAGVNRSNAVISLINSIEGGDFAAQLAEARFLRGHFNFELQKIYGNVPYISDENFDAKEFNQPNPGAIWDQIEADLQYAVDNLPATQGDAGRPTSWTAKAFLGKAHLFQSDFAQAGPLFEDVIANGPYDLNTEFLDNFSLTGDNGTESIFAIQFTTDSGQSLNGNRGGTLNFPNPGPFGSCCGFYQPTQDLVNAYQTDGTGLPLLDTFNQTDVDNDYGVESEDAFTPHTGPLDPRLDYTVGRRGIDYNGYGPHIGKDWIRASFADISGPYLPKKNVYQSGENGNVGTGAWGQQHSGINYHIMRYADLLLMAAEVAVENNDLPKALGYVNEVRNRAKAMTYIKEEVSAGVFQDAANYEIEPYASFPDQDFARNAVRFERRLELAMEGHRLFDLRRWGVAPDVINNYVTNEARVIANFGTKAGTYAPNMDLIPIPINAIDLSGGVLEQNPGF